MNPATGEFHDLEVLRKAGESAEALEKRLQNLGWMELSVGEIIKMKGHDFEVQWIGTDAVLLRSVKFVDPSAKNR